MIEVACKGEGVLVRYFQHLFKLDQLHKELLDLGSG